MLSLALRLPCVGVFMNNVESKTRTPVSPSFSSLEYYHTMQIRGGWVAPSSEVLASLSELTGVPNIALAAIAGMKRTDYSGLCSEKRFLLGYEINYSQSRLIFDAVGLTSPLRLEPKIPKFKPSIFTSEHFTPPTDDEFRYIMSRTGLGERAKAAQIAEAVGITENMVSMCRSYTHRESRIDVPVDKDKWLKWLAQHEIHNQADLTKLPALQVEALKAYNDGFRAPFAAKLRDFLYWTGYSLEELASFIGASADDFRTLTSYDAKNKNFYIHYDKWRLLLEIFRVVEPVTSVMCDDGKKRDIKRRTD